MQRSREKNIAAGSGFAWQNSIRPQSSSMPPPSLFPLPSMIVPKPSESSDSKSALVTNPQATSVPVPPSHLTQDPKPIVRPSVRRCRSARNEPRTNDDIPSQPPATQRTIAAQPRHVFQRAQGPAPSPTCSWPTGNPQLLNCKDRLQERFIWAH